MHMTMMELNAEIANQLRLISGNDKLMRKALHYLKGLSAQLPTTKREDEYTQTKKFIESFAGKWRDERTPDEMVDAIYAGRKSGDNEDLVEILSK